MPAPEAHASSSTRANAIGMFNIKKKPILRIKTFFLQFVYIVKLCELVSEVT